jgi:hypothetical protein
MPETVFGLTLADFAARERSQVCWRCADGWVEHVVCGYGRLCDPCYQRRLRILGGAARRTAAPTSGTCRCKEETQTERAT